MKKTTASVLILLFSFSTSFSAFAIEPTANAPADAASSPTAVAGGTMQDHDKMVEACEGTHGKADCDQMMKKCEGNKDLSKCMATHMKQSRHKKK